MGSAIRQLNQIHLSAASEMNLFEPPRGPANVTPLPLNPAPWTFVPERGAEASVHELRAAMLLAGLSDARRFFRARKARTPPALACASAGPPPRARRRAARG